MTKAVKPNFSILGDNPLAELTLPVEGVSKRCSKCGEVKLLDAFYRDRSGRAGRSARCSARAIAHVRAYCVDNRETVVGKRKARYHANPEKSRASKNAWYSANPEKARAKKSANARARYAADPEKSRAAKCAKRASNIERSRDQETARARARYAADPEKAKAASRAYKARNREKINEAQRAKRAAAKIVKT